MVSRRSRRLPASGSSVTSRRMASSQRADIKSYLNRILIPAWGGREFASIKRSDIAKVLDDVEDQSGVIAADYVLSVIRGICNLVRHAQRQLQ